MANKKAVVLLSGGIDSATTLAIAKSENYDTHAISFDYGQRHKKELESAKKIARHYRAKHKILKLDLNFVSSSLLQKKQKIPERNIKDLGRDIPSTYVPARNLIFLAYASAYAESIGASKIFIGANAIDYSGYPDCRPDFYKALQEVIKVGTKTGVEGKAIDIKYPLINLTKAEIIKKGLSLKVPYHLTWSCYRGKRKACGKCDSCLIRLKGFREAGIKDTIEYEKI
ncbi:MAG: 7-cyano-7-deazaguanine synthase QueC [Candidatus Thermoplasmatota archaeon]|nr:7-cyano-7-deazaguanine synthase QueC [Candidatus Thermoplasmatota archaeon]